MLLMWACTCGMCCMTQRTRSDTSDDERPKETNEMQFKHAALLEGRGTGAETQGCRGTVGRDRGQNKGVVTVGVAIPLRCSSATWASSCPNLSARRKGSASSDPSNANHVDHKLGLGAPRVLSAKSLYTSPRVAQKGVASTQMTIRSFGAMRPWGCCV